MNRDVIVRAAEPEDVNAVAELLAQPQALWGTLQLPYMSVEERRRRWASNAPHNHLVAVIEERVVGWAHFTQYEGRRSHVGSLGMAVHDAFAGRGAGRALLAAILEKADRWLNLKRVELAVYVDNARAIALYERFGFEREGLLRRYAFRDGDYADALSMARLRP